MYRLIFATAIILGFCTSKAQKVIYNFDIHKDWGKFEEVVNTWQAFLASTSDSEGARYWNEAELEKYGNENYFLLNSEYNPSLLRMAKAYHVQILNITKEGSFHKITSQFYHPKNDTLMTLCILEIYVSKQGDEYKLHNALPINLQRHWNSTTVGYIRFHYPKGHNFDLTKAEKQNAFITQTLPDIFEVTPDTVDYFFADTQEELNRLKGFVFNIGGSGTQKPSGKAAPGHIVYAVGTGEYYPHELVHVFVDPTLPPSHPWVSEGLATFLGGSRGKPLIWHINRTNDYLLEHPEINLNDMLELVTLDEYTGYRYVLGGVVIQLIYEKEDWEGVKEFLHETADAEEYYAAVEKHLGWKRKDLDKKMRASLKHLASER